MNQTEEQRAGDPKTHPHELEALAKHPSRNVRQTVAANSSTPLAVLRDLAVDENVWVRARAAKNPRTPADALAPLLRDKFVLVRSALAENPATPPDMLAKLARETDWRIRGGVARNRNTPSEVVELLVFDDDWMVRSEVARRPELSAETLTVLAQNPDCVVRAVALAHPTTPAPVRRTAFFWTLAEAPGLLHNLAWTEDLDGISWAEWHVGLTVADQYVDDPTRLEAFVVAAAEEMRLATEAKSSMRPPVAAKPLGANRL